MSARFSDTAIEAAKDEAERWERFRDSAGFAAGGLIPAITQIYGFEVGWLCGAASAAMALLGGRKARSAKRRADDPPDLARAHQRVVLRRPPLDWTTWEQLMPEVTLPASSALTDATAYEEAFVRAVERADGARVLDRPDLEEARLKEARRYGEAAVEGNELVESRVHELADRLPDVSGAFDPTSPRRSPFYFDWSLDRVLLLDLIRGGIPYRELHFKVPLDPNAWLVTFAALLDSLRGAADATGASAFALRGDVARLGQADR